MKTLIHPTAVIHPHSEVHPTVQVGAYAVIGANVKVGPETIIGAHAVLEGPCEIGAHNQIFTGAAIGMEPQDLKYVGEPTWVKIGDNNLIREYVTINRATGSGEATVIGNGNLLMAYVHVGHNCVIKDSVVIANSVALAGHVHIESRARLSGVLGVHQFVHIGTMAMVGGMARIDRDVPPYMLVEGNPARVRSLNLVGLKRSGMSAQDLQILKKAYRSLYRSELIFKDALEELELLGDSVELQHLRRFLLLSQMPGRRGLIPGRSKKVRTEDE
ncbi:acyl-[acyl-carrier-protein]--UDP-N-acetylglucosamine O-acyltransferase [Richelia sinica FACHB-800]|uniref:Acyl-[acyl-carrier-protein]--UDP-N-acetylglucosamine O-acyltransferase n=1 Tax=Richelia sinica FACHB-800 TaxID=1357546 RepID=A0A975Y6B2_9NOST|nr:acyl-ACP--UDP-N-acetylglucosamine O-acyltransferase [Richelia sinica]MBD2664160.1 acyl-ACP--UDP-N-acetylglucosamine O-acyltransferase [Richelia sinica FACHB-800]QXE25079.1 acyl-[acyl-carrier-protein]--UDP-N-acetylglucosamine O-acyltransferase [Richelia sinica FACHB-800]